MVEVLTPEQKSLLLAGYVLGDLSAEEGRLLVQMLEAEPALRSELADLQTSFELAYGASKTPPSSLKASILVGSEKSFEKSFEASFEKAEPLVEQPLPAGRNRRWAWQGVGAIAAGLIVALVVQNQHLRERVAVLQAEQGSGQVESVAETIDVALSAVDAAAQLGQVSLVIDPTDLNAVLVAEGLAPLAADEVYVLWTVVQPGVPVTTDEKGAILTAVFTVEEDGRRVQEIGLPGVFESVGDVRAIAVTVEDAAAPQRHLSSPILIEEL